MTAASLGASPPKGQPMTRRHANEFRPAEALKLISADREGKSLHCPCCGNATVDRTPPRTSERAAACRVQLACAGCGRLVAYIDRDLLPPRH